MPLLLHIETAVEGASLCLSEGPDIIGFTGNPSQKDSAAWVQPALQELLKQSKATLKQVEAVSVSAGPGSYTGLRVGLSSAKGLCYALGIPLITVSTLKMMAVAAGEQEADLLCPMIDARRLEVFTAVYDKQLNEIVAPHNLILEAGSFAGMLGKQRVCFFGNGSPKFAPIVNNPNALFVSCLADARSLVPLALQIFEAKAFADLAYAEPYYGKEFFSTYMKSNS
jgi:tRNA threonylcarbamoyladenosine biosynthesis protein TsaB